MTQQADGDFPLFEFQGQELFVSFRVKSFIPEIEIERHIQGMWVQVLPDYSLQYYLPVPCLDVFVDQNISTQFYDQVHDMQCADMLGDSIRLRNGGKSAGGD